MTPSVWRTTRYCSDLITHFRIEKDVVNQNQMAKWPRQARELIIDSDLEILYFWSLDQKTLEEEDKLKGIRMKIFVAGKLFC